MINARGNGSKTLFFLEEMTAKPWMTWFSLPPFCTSCSWIHFIALLRCHCAEHYGRGAELVAPYFQGSHRGGTLGWGAMQERQQFAEHGLGVAPELGQHGNGCPPSVGKQAQESFGCEWERTALQGWEGFKLLLVTLLETVQDSVPPSEGLMLEVLCRGEFSTPHDIKFFVLSRALPHSSTVGVLQHSGYSRDGGMRV